MTEEPDRQTTAANDCTDDADRSPEAEVAAWYMGRKGLSRVPVKRKMHVNDYLWYFYYDVDGGELELEIEWDPETEEWSAKSTAFKVDQPAEGSSGPARS